MTTRRFATGAIGNAVALLVVAALAAWLYGLHGEIEWISPDLRRALAAMLSVVAYAALCAAIAWPRLRAQRARGEVAGDVLWVIHASQTGQAERLAERTAQSLRDAGVAVRVEALGRVRADDLRSMRRALFVASTTGEGDAPDDALPFLRDVLAADIDLPQLEYGLLALGDRSYDDFCAFGRRIDAWLRHAGARPLFDRIDVDDGDAAALRHWQHHLGVLSGRTDLPDWTPPRYETWRLRARRETNPGSIGGACFVLELVPGEGALPAWRAGDLVEIAPCAVDAPDLATLPHREYSIASIPSEGALLLLVRRMTRADGTPGFGSDWLTRRARVGERIALRIRANANFHAPDGERPLILVGNGTGIAGLRALLAERVARGHRRNWLVFGERNADRDFHFSDDIERWRAQGFVERLDLAFSRDVARSDGDTSTDATPVLPRKAYVQHRLAEATDTLREWIADGASIFVCGSLEGMAPGVHAALVDALGDATVEQLLVAGRYRRDVY